MRARAVIARGQEVADSADHYYTGFKPIILALEQEASMELVTDNAQDLHQASDAVDLQPVCPEKCYATGDGLKTATVGEEATVTLHAVDSDGGECEVSVDSVTAQLVHSKHTTAVKCEVVKHNRTTCSIQYTPEIRGKHTLHVQVKQRHIKGSPFTVTSMPSPQDLGNPIQMIRNLQRPHCMVTNTDNQIVVTESTRHCVSVLAPDGMKIQSFGSKGSGNGEFNFPRGIAQDKEGNIYVTESGSSRIQKFTSGGEFISRVGKRGHGLLEFDGPFGITFNTVSGKLYVCDTDCHRIQVLNTDLTLRSTFGSQGNGNGQFQRPVGSACDNTGNVYVAECNNHRIQVFTPEGKFLRKFGSRGSSPGQFISPMDITIGDNKLYVCDMGNNCICVFTTEGEFLTSFGSQGNKRGQFKAPAGIHITADSYLLVSDFKNNRIQMF